MKNAGNRTASESIEKTSQRVLTTERVRVGTMVMTAVIGAIAAATLATAGWGLKYVRDISAAGFDRDKQLVALISDQKHDKETVIASINALDKTFTGKADQLGKSLDDYRHASEESTREMRSKYELLDNKINALQISLMQRQDSIRK